MSTSDIQKIMHRLESMEEHHKNIHADLSSQIVDFRTEMEPVRELYSNLAGATVVVKWIFILLTSLGGAHVLMTNIFKIKS